MKYRVKFPKKVIAIDLGEKGDLYVRFKLTDEPLGEPSDDGRVIFFYESEDQSTPVAVEILDVGML